MKSIHTFNVRASLPAVLQPLLRLAFNLRCSWDHAEINLLRRLDHDLWETCNGNPVLALGCVQQSTLEAAAKDDSFLAHMQAEVDRLGPFVSGDRSRRNPSLSANRCFRNLRADDAARAKEVAA